VSDWLNPLARGAVQTDPYDYSARYNTQLQPADEAKFQAWASSNDKLRDLYDYDIRGFWQSGGGALDPRGHATDQFKKPNHPTFSDQSQYHGPDTPGGVWGQGTFTPSAHNLSMMSAPALQRYFSEREPDYRLVLPTQQDQR
jgi:hypothetical protein